MFISARAAGGIARICFFFVIVEGPLFLPYGAVFMVAKRRDMFDTTKQRIIQNNSNVTLLLKLRCRMSLNELNETQSKFILERIHQTEKNAANLHDAVSVLVRKQSK